MIIIAMIGLTFAWLSADRLVALIADAAATGLATWYFWRSARVLLASGLPDLAERPPTTLQSRAERRLMARHLRAAMKLTALSNLLPASSARGERLFHMLADRRG